MSAPQVPGIAVELGPRGRLDRHFDLFAEASRVQGDAPRAIQLARRLDDVAFPGEGETLQLWGLLATLGSIDLTAARVAEAHLDARSILRQAGSTAGDGAWGVFAAEAAGVRLDGTAAGDGWRLSGTKPWCSLAGMLDSALITAHTPVGRRLFALDLREKGVTVEPGAWFARGLSEVTSGPIHLEDVPATAVGDTGWYLTRSGFSWGGIGVAACWFGGAIGVARALLAQARIREPDQIALSHIGALDASIHANRVLLEHAATEVDAGRAEGEAGGILAARVRASIADLVEETILRTGHALGPAPLSFDDEHARRIADLQLYVRQHHAERDQASLGRAALAAGVTW